MSQSKKIKDLLIEAQEIINNMLDNLDNNAGIKFLAGQLALTTELIFDAIQKN